MFWQSMWNQESQASHMTPLCSQVTGSLQIPQGKTVELTLSSAGLVGLDCSSMSQSAGCINGPGFNSRSPHCKIIAKSMFLIKLLDFGVSLWYGESGR